MTIIVLLATTNDRAVWIRRNFALDCLEKGLPRLGENYNHVGFACTSRKAQQYRTLYCETED